MKLFHRCRWVLITCQKKQWEGDDDIFAVHRPVMTTVLYRCGCGIHRGEDLVGHWTPAELLATNDVEALA